MKNDIQMKQILETFDNTLKAVEVQRKEFDDANARLTDMINNFEASIVSKVSETLKSTRHTRQQVVAFSVRDLQNKTPKRGETMIYNTVIQNVGGAFDPDSGKFTAPVDAVYLFAVQVSTSTNKWGRVKIVLNGREVHSISKYNGAAAHTSSSGTIIQRLTAGDQVWVKQDNYNGDAYVDGSVYGWNQFTGVQI